jgi:hypothetical protein
MKDYLKIYLNLLLICYIKNYKYEDYSIQLEDFYYHHILIFNFLKMIFKFYVKLYQKNPLINKYQDLIMNKFLYNQIKYIYLNFL